MKEKNTKQKVNRRIIATAIILLAILLAFLYARSFTGNSILSDFFSKSDDSDKILPRHIFYHTPRVAQNSEYSSTCFPAGEVMYALPENKCCSGLKSLAIIDEAEPGCSFLYGSVLCSNCGNKRCEYGENNCNCPQDCKKK